MPLISVIPNPSLTGQPSALQRLGQGGAEWRGRTEHVAQRGQVTAFQVRVGERDSHCRHDVGTGDAMTLDQVQELSEPEARHADHCRPGLQRNVEDHVQTVDVEERERGDHHVIRSDVQRLLGQGQRCDKIAVAEENALG
jgi:hypothetical protein